MIGPGYLHALIDNKLTLKEWLLVCARGFTPLLEMRDEAMGVEISEEFPVSTHHKDGKVSAQRELDALAVTTDDELLQRESRGRVNQLAEAKKGLAEAKDERATCARMMEELAQWDAPEELTNLKQYMIEMLNDALGKLEAIRKVRVECLERSIQYHKEGYEEEVEERKHQRKWLKALHEATR